MANVFRDDDGIFYVKESSNGDTQTIFVCSYIEITKVLKNIQTKEIQLEITYIHNDEEDSFVIPRSSLEAKSFETTLLSRGVELNSKVLWAAVELLQESDEKDKGKQFYTHDFLGFSEFNGKNEFFHQDVITNQGIRSAYTGGLDIKPKGSIEEWRTKMVPILDVNIYAAFGVLMGLSAPIASIFKQSKEFDNLFFSIVGNSSSGKTTVAMLAISMFGNPSKSANGLTKSWSATENALIGFLNGLNGVPILLDEHSQKSSSDMSSFIYQQSDGVERARLNSDGSQKNSKRWSNTVISTSEISIFENSKQNSGLRARVIEIKDVNWFKSREEAESVKEIARNIYGVVGIEFVKELNKYTQQTLFETFDSIYKKIENQIVQADSVTQRIVNKYSLVILTLRIANKALNLNIDEGEIIKFLLKIDDESSDDRDIGKKALECVQDYVVTNPGKFYFDINEGSNNAMAKLRNSSLANVTTALGMMKDVGEDSCKLVIQKDNLKKILKPSGFENIDVILSDWRTKKNIEVGTTGFTKKVSMLGQPKRVNAVVIVFKKDKISVDDMLDMEITC